MSEKAIDRLVREGAELSVCKSWDIWKAILRVYSNGGCVTLESNGMSSASATESLEKLASQVFPVQN